MAGSTRTVTAPVGTSSDLRAVMTAYQQGDLSAFDELHARLAPRLRLYLIAACRDAAAADDLVQETFLQIHRARCTYQPSLPVEPWVFAIARHVFLTWCRARARRHEIDAIDLDAVAGTLADPAANPLDALAVVEDVRHGLAHLPAATRRAVLLHHLAGWSFDAIAEQLATNSRAARLRSSRGVRALRQIVGR